MSHPDKKPTRAEIEQLVQSRKGPSARKQISRYLRQNKRNEVLFECCEWYRRLGYYADGFQLLNTERLKGQRLSTAIFDGKRLLWTARFLNLLGAGQFALKIAAQIEPTGTDAWLIKGGILLVNYEHEKALPYFAKTISVLQSRDNQHDNRIRYLATVSAADCLNHRGSAREALKLVENIIEQAPNPVLKAIGLQAMGEYLARSGDMHAAFSRLEQAQPLFPQDDVTPDFGIYQKWRGFVLAKLGKPVEARIASQQALAILRKASMPAEAWLEIYHLQGQSVSALSSEENFSLLFYPGSPPGFLRSSPRPAEAVWGNPDSSSIFIDLAGDEYRIQKQHTLGIPLEVALLAQLRRAAHWGIGLERLKQVLYPGETFSYQELKERLNKLVKRLRDTHHIQILRDKGFLFLKKSESHRVAVRAAIEPGLPLALKRLTEFHRTEMERVFNISKSGARPYVDLWLRNKWIRREGRGKNTKYLVLSK